MDIHEQVNKILSDAMPDTIQADAYQQERARWYAEQALDMHKDKGSWEVGSIQSLIMTNPMPGMYSLQFWFVVLVDSAQMKVQGAIFSETRD